MDGQPTIEDLERQLEDIQQRLEPLLWTRDHLRERIRVQRQALYRSQIGLSPDAELVVTQEFMDFMNSHHVKYWGWRIGEPCGIYGVIDDIVAVTTEPDGSGSYVVNIPAEIVQRMAHPAHPLPAPTGEDGGA